MPKRIVEFICEKCKKPSKRLVGASYMGKPTYCSKECHKKGIATSRVW